MKIAGLVLVLSCLLAAVPAGAGIVEVTRSVTVPASASDEEVKDAVNAAARDALGDVGGELRPVMMVVTAAYMSAGRLYIRFLIADEDGARLLGVRHGDHADRGHELQI